MPRQDLMVSSYRILNRVHPNRTDYKLIYLTMSINRLLMTEICLMMKILTVWSPLIINALSVINGYMG